MCFNQFLWGLLRTKGKVEGSTVPPHRQWEEPQQPKTVGAYSSILVNEGAISSFSFLLWL